MHGAWGMGNKAVEDGGESGSSQSKKDEIWKILFSTVFQIFLHHYVCYHLGIVEMSWSW